MGLCASRALGVLENLEEREEESSFQIVSEASSARMSSSGSRSSRNSTTLFKAALSFDSSRSSAEVGEMGKLGALLCKRRPFVGNPDILSAHLTNLLNSILRTSAQEVKSPPEISFASYLSTPFIRPQGFQRYAMEDDGLNAIAKAYAESAAKAAARDTFLFLEKNDRVQTFESSSGKSLDELRGYALASCSVPEEDEITVVEEEEAEEEEETDLAAVEMSSEEYHPGTVDLFRPGMYYEEDEIVVAAEYTEQKSHFEFTYPATTSRWASVVNAARQSAWLPRRPLEGPAKTVDKKQGQGNFDLEGKAECEGASSNLGLERGAPASEAHLEKGEATSSPILGCVACCSRGEHRKSSSATGSATADITGDRTASSGSSDPMYRSNICEDSRINPELLETGASSRSSEAQKGESSGSNSEIQELHLQDADRKLGQNLGCKHGEDFAAGQERRGSSGNEDPKNPGCLAYPAGGLQIRIAEAGKERIDDPSCSSSSSRMWTQDQPRQQEEEEEEEDSDNSDPDPDSFFSFPSSPSSKIFEEVGSGHIIEQMKSTKLMQEMACRKMVEEFGGVGDFEACPRCSHEETGAAAHSRNATFGSTFAAAARSHLEEATTTTITTHERAASSSSFDKRLKFLSLERACNAAISKRFVVLESVASAQDTCTSNLRDGHHAVSSHESRCESFGVDNTHSIRMMSFTRKDFACLQMKKCVNNTNEMGDLPSATATTSESGTLRSLIHGSKTVRKASTKAKSVKDLASKKPKYVEHVEESAATFSSTGKGLVLLKLGLLRRKHLAVKNTAEKSFVSTTVNRSPTDSVSRSVDVENNPPF